MKKHTLKTFQIFTVLASLFFISACSTMSSSTDSRANLEQQARAALNTLHETTPQTKQLQAHAILVFPNILKAGLMVGSSGGNGVLFTPDGHVQSYYNTTSLSYGLQAGAQSYSQVMFLMTPKALEYLNSSSGWSVGVGPSIVVMDTSMAKDISTTTTRSDVYAFIFGQQGLMGGVGVQGQKITRLEP